MKEIPLTRGMVALVSDEDYGRVSQFNWCIHQGASDLLYARRGYWIREGGKKKFVAVAMHRFITGAKQGEVVDHINHNGLDNRRENLRVCTQGQNFQNRVPTHEAGYRGVHMRNGYYVAMLGRPGIVLRLGSFYTAEEAAAVSDAATILMGDEFSWLNFDQICPRAMNLAIAAFIGEQVPGVIRRGNKLTDEDVINIRTRYATGKVLHRELAEEYGVCVAAISHAVNGRTFTHTTNPPPDRIDRWRKEAA